MPDAKNKGGRPTKLNDEIVGRIADAVRAGAYVETAAAFAGINKDTFYAWLKRGAKDRERHTTSAHTRFADAIEKAGADAEIFALATIQQFAKGFPVEQTTVIMERNAAGELKEIERRTETKSRREWQAAAWMLERSHPERWGRRDRMELSGPGGEALKPAVIYLPSNGRELPVEGAEEQGE
jgi:transposase